MADEPHELENSTPFAALRRMARRPASQNEERCDLCGEGLPTEHRHLLDLTTRQVFCACRACVVLLDSPIAGGRARRLIPTRRLYLPDFVLTDAQWESLQVPVNMAFFCYNSAAQRITAFYPSPLGPTEAQLPMSAWEELALPNPILRQMEPDVEALLVHRERERADCYLVPIDECYRLVGLIRFHWRGLSGGGAVREEIGRFFAGLRERSEPAGGVHA
jgi:hypothetical protein